MKFIAYSILFIAGASVLYFIGLMEFTSLKLIFKRIKPLKKD
ncbi:hypothetical protein R9X47_10485 [Wukongibacter baidiensis]